MLRGQTVEYQRGPSTYPRFPPETSTVVVIFARVAQIDKLFKIQDTKEIEMMKLRLPRMRVLR